MNFIINSLEYNEIPYMIQTHLSDQTVKKILGLKPTFELHLSYHVTEQSLEDFINKLILLKDYNIQKIDVMYSISGCEKEYLKLLTAMKHNDINISTHLTPIADFHDNSPAAENLLVE